MLGSSRTAVCGQAPVSTPRDPFFEQDALERALDVLGIFRGDHIIGDNQDFDAHLDEDGGHGFDDCGLARADRATDADACDFFFMACSGDSVHEHAYVRLDVRGCHDIERG